MQIAMGALPDLDTPNKLEFHIKKFITRGIDHQSYTISVCEHNPKSNSNAVQARSSSLTIKLQNSNQM